jgi:uncharacterized cupredoxin-like copper-binding protein
MKKLLAPVFLFLVLAMYLAACGNSAPSTQIDITMSDFAFSPSRFTVPTGEAITFSAVHDGSVVHSFIIMKAGTDAGHKFDKDDEVNVYWKVEIQPGDSKTAVFTAPTRPGEYQVLCGMPGHLEAGMIGTLIVVAAQ